MNNNKWIEFIVGLFTIAGIAALLVLVLQATNFNQFSHDSSYTVKAAFENISGLKERSQVSIAGVTVGKVKQIDIDAQTFEALITLEISSQYNQIPDDSTVSVYTAGLLGEKYLAIEIGASEEFLKQDSTISLTQSSVVLEKLISKFILSKGEE